MTFIKNVDPELYDIIQKEHDREHNTTELIASENFTSAAVLEAAGGIMTNKYAEGYPGRRYYGGCEHVDEAEDLARDRLKRLFNVEYANVQPHSGSQANMATFMTFLNIGDTVMGLDLSHVVTSLMVVLLIFLVSYIILLAITLIKKLEEWTLMS